MCSFIERRLFTFKVNQRLRDACLFHSDNSKSILIRYIVIVFQRSVSDNFNNSRVPSVTKGFSTLLWNNTREDKSNNKKCKRHVSLSLKNFPIGPSGALSILSQRSGLILSQEKTIDKRNDIPSIIHVE